MPVKPALAAASKRARQSCSVNSMDRLAAKRGMVVSCRFEGPCGSGLARESDEPADIFVGYEAVFASKPAPIKGSDSSSVEQRNPRRRTVGHRLEGYTS